MAQKKITELALRDEVTSDLNLPSDDGIQSYRVTAAQMKSFILANQNILLAMLKDDIFNGLTGVSAADDDYFPLIDTSDSNKTKKALVGTFVRQLYRTVNNPSSTAVDSTDATIKITGTTGSLVLPTAVGIEGKRYKFIHAGSQLVAYTITTTSSQTIGGVAAGDYKLWTTNEVLEVESDGANWLILNHWAKTDWIDAGSITVGAVTTAPDKATTKTRDKVFWRRDGNTGYFRYEYAHANKTGATAGSGDYLYTLPGSLQWGSRIVVSTSTIATIDALGWSKEAFGESYVFTDGSSESGGFAGAIVPYDSTKFRLIFNNMYVTAGPQDSSFFHYSYANNFSWACEFNAPISGWQP